MLTKALSGLKITDADQGRVQAVFATFNVKDHDGDVTLPGAFEEGDAVRISAYNHKSWAGALPVGKGVIVNTDDGGVLDGQFFMNTSHGRDTFETVKQLEDLAEWSYGYDIVDAYPGDFEGEPVQFLKRMKVHEVSPVLLGAGIDTRTLAMKGHKLACEKCSKSATPLFDAMGHVKAAICSECGHVERKQLDSDLEEELSDAGSERFGGADTYVWLYDHDVDENFAVFSVCPQNGNGERQLVQVSFNRNDDGTVTLQPGQTNVEPQTTFVPEKANDPAEGAKTADEPDKGNTSDSPESGESTDEPALALKLIDHLKTVLAAVDGVTERLDSVMALRAEQGKSLGEETRSTAADLADQLEARAKALREVVTSAAADQRADAENDDGALTLEDETQLAELAARHGLSL